MKSSEGEERKGSGIGERYHQETKYSPGRMGSALDRQNMPEPHKNYASPLSPRLCCRSTGSTRRQPRVFTSGLSKSAHIAYMKSNSPCFHMWLTIHLTFL